MSVRIHNTIKRSDGVPQSGVPVTINISWDTSESPIAVDTVNEVTIDGPDSEISDNDGYWGTIIVPNSTIAPANSVYRITEQVAGIVRTSFVSVPDTDGTDFWIGDIMVDAPSWEV